MDEATKKAFSGEYRYGWWRADGECPTLDIPGHKVRTYGADSKCHIRSSFMVNVYIGKEDVMQEILFLHPKTANDWVPVSYKAFRALFPTEDTYNFDNGNWCWNCPSWHTCVEFVDMDDHLLFKFGAKFWQWLAWGVNLDVIGSTYAGLFIRRFGPYALTYPTLHPEAIKTLDDAARLKHAVSGLSTLSWKRNNKYYEKEIQRVRDKMASAMKSIKDYSESYDRICGAAAEAMDGLSEKYGINVAL